MTLKVDQYCYETSAPYTKTYKICIVVQCRFDSSRLPGKALIEIGDKKVALEILLEKLSKTKYPVIVATTRRATDNKIVKFVKQKFPNIKVVQGDYKNVLLRYEMATNAGYDYFFRITADDLFVATEYFEEALERCKRGNYDYFFTKDLIRGFDFEIIKTAALHSACDEFSELKNLESFEHCFKNTGHYFIGHFKFPEQYSSKVSNINLTLDTSHDLELIKEVYKRLDGDVTLEKTVDLFNKNKDLFSSNTIPRISIYILNKNYTEHLENCIRAIFNQKTEVLFEVIVVDYGSADIEAVREIINRYPKINYYEVDWVSFVDAIQFAVSKCKAEYIIRADADDVLYPQAIEKLCEWQGRGYSLVFPNYDCNQVKTDWLASHAMLERKKIEFMQFRENQIFRDGTVVLETCKKYGFKIKYLEEKLFFHNVHSESLTQSRKKEIRKYDRSIKQAIRGNS